MKQRIVMLAFALFVSTSVYSTVGKHNGLISVGGGLNYSTKTPNIPNNAKSSASLGGGYIIELGYLYLHDTDNFVHGVDTRASFGQNFNKMTSLSGEKVDENFLDIIGVSAFDLNSLYFQVGSTYQFGFRRNGGRLMLDILGLNLGYFSGDTKTTYKTGVTHKDMFGNHFLLGINLPLGINYIFDNGLMLGFRHRLDFTFSNEKVGAKITGTDHTVTTPEKGGSFGIHDTQSSYIAYNLAFSIGYVFGK